MNVIEFNNVWKRFRKGERLNSLRDAIPNLFRKGLLINGNNSLKKDEFWALQGVNFQIKKGEVVGIIGSNGAGKSTILKLLAGIMKPNKGEVRVTGRLSALIEVTAGFHPELTGRENVYLNGTILGMSKKEIDSKFDVIVEFSGIKEFIDTPVKRYSSGMYSRLGFSVAAHMDPDILLVDEVLAVGDIAFQAKCAQKMRELLASGTTILLISHNLALIQSLCKRVILLDRGQIQKEGASGEVIPYYQNTVYKKQEEELKNKVSSNDYKVMVNQDTVVNIIDVFLCDGENKNKEEFKVGEPISVNIEYEAKERIEKPVFSLNIIRADGVLCLSSWSNEDGFSLASIEKKGKIKVDLGRLNLNSGIYQIKASIWEKNLLNAYHNKIIIFKIESNENQVINHAVLINKLNWKR